MPLNRRFVDRDNRRKTNGFKPLRRLWLDLAQAPLASLPCLCLSTGGAAVTDTKISQEEPAAIYHDAFPLCEADARTPFEGKGDADAGHLFLYLTHAARVRWTRLFGAKAEDGAAAAALKGFRFRKDREAALWLLRVEYASQPRGAKGGGTLKDNVEPCPFPPEGLPRRDWPMLKYVVLVDPARCERSGPRAEVVSYHEDRDEAIAASQAATKEHGIATVAALLLEDWPWVAPPKPASGAAGPAGKVVKSGRGAVVVPKSGSAAKGAAKPSASSKGAGVPPAKPRRPKPADK
jgi:hypothetical protein